MWNNNNTIPVVWVNKGNAGMKDSHELAQDPLYGVDSDITGVVQLVDDHGVTHSFIVAEDYSEDSGVVEKLEKLVRASNSHLPLLTVSVMGDFWPIEVGVGEGYDVYMTEFRGISVAWIDNSNPV